jgi:glutamate formiminotransferase/glutamate formiminotransferase/formiminotetrahydrofolate cyclodeaminase
VLEAVPNFSEGRRTEVIERVGHALSSRDAKLLDVHSDADHNRTVFTLVGGAQALADALTAGAREAVASIDMRVHEGAHPCIGALDVAPIVYLRGEDRRLACDEALAVANRIAGELDVPVFLYGELAGSEERGERAYFREGGIGSLAERMAAGELEPDFGPGRPHPTGGATLVGCRPPLVAFNVELEGSDLVTAKKIAAEVREGGGGLTGVRAIGVVLERRGICQVSTNVHDPFAVPLRDELGAVRVAAERHRAAVSGAELVGLAPAAALEGFPQEVELRGFDKATHILDARLFSAHGAADSAA